ncbi:MAG: Swt1 family HEPN domain-containing protein [Roseiflexaceae bacterium]
MSSENFSQNAFLAKLVGSFEEIERCRIVIITHIRKQDFQTLYVLTDEISETIAQRIYPRINRVENRLRKYIIKFFATKLGTDWWRLTADADMQIKAQQRKNNETFFAPLIDNRAYLIDFGELGKIVYAQSSGFISKEDIIKKIVSMKAESYAVTQLQTEIQSNYTKYFKTTFKEASFQSKWEELEKIRHKVAHNNLFTQEDYNKAMSLTSELEVIIDNADQEVLKVVLSPGEREAIEDIIVESIIADDQENISDWRTEIKNTIQALGGEADLSDIYNYILNHTKRDLPNSWPQIVRYTIQANSSDSISFKGKVDIFKKVGKGKWALRVDETEIPPDAS